MIEVDLRRMVYRCAKCDWTSTPTRHSGECLDALNIHLREIHNGWPPLVEGAVVVGHMYLLDPEEVDPGYEQLGLHDALLAASSEPKTTEGDK